MLFSLQMEYIFEKASKSCIIFFIFGLIAYYAWVRTMQFGCHYPCCCRRVAKMVVVLCMSVFTKSQTLTAAALNMET